MADDFPIILQARADTRQFERDIATATERAGKNIKPLPLGKITGQFSEFNKSLDAATARVITFSATTGIINGVVNAFKALVKETIFVEKALADINTVLNSNQKGLESFRATLFDIARNTAQSFKSVSEAALELSRQGLSIEETLKRTKDAMILTRISGLDAAEAVNVLTAAVNGFQKVALDTTDIVNKLATVDSNFAVSTKDLAEALTRVGSTADDAGVSFNELLAAVTAVQQTTSRGGAVIGNAFKTIFTRLSRADTITQLRELGVAIDETQNGVQKLQAISTAIKSVDAATANTIKELSGGVFQINVVSAALGDLGKEFSIYGNALKVAGTATNEAIKRNEQLNQTLSALSSESLTNIQDVLSKIGSISIGNNLKNLFASFNGITKSLSESLDGEGVGAELGKGILTGIGNFITGPGAIVVFGGFLKLATQVAKDISASFRQVLGITTEADKQAKIQAQISSILQQNDALYGKYLTTSKGVALVQNEILNILKAQSAAAANVTAASAQMTKALSPQFTTTKKGAVVPRNAAEGLIPAMAAETVAIKQGVGGASGNEQLAYIPSFNYGNGKKGPVVANTGEIIIENFLGGEGSAILTKDMVEALGGEEKLGLLGKVKGFAEGFVPGFVKKTFMKGADFLGAGIFGDVFKNDAMTGKKGLPEMVFKQFKPGNASEDFDPIENEFIQSKLAEELGLPVAKVHGSLSRSKQRGGIFKEYVGGFLGDDIIDELPLMEKRDFRYSLEDIFAQKGILAGDLQPSNYKVEDNIDEVKQLYKDKGYQALKERILPKTKVIDPGLFLSNKKETINRERVLKTSSKADGHIPDLASAMDREVTALIEMGYPKDKAMKSVEVGKDPILKNSKNPEGLGVYNKIQGQTSLADAFSDHKGENWKTVGKATGHVPNLALSGDDELRLQAQSIKFGGLENAIKKGLDISNIDFTASETTIKRKLSKLIEDSFDIDFKSFGGSAGKKFKSNLIQEVRDVRADEIEEQQTVANQQRRKIDSVRIQKDYDERVRANEGGPSMTATEALNRANAARAAKAAAAPRSNQDIADDIAALREDLLDEGKDKLNKRGAFSFKTSGSVFKSLDTSRLDESQKKALRADIKRESTLQRKQALGGTAGIGLSIGASLASPLLFQGGQAIRESAGSKPLSTGQKVGAGALEVAGGAANALSFAAPFAAALGPVGLAATAAAGAVYSLVDALDDSDEEATRLTKSFEELTSKNTAFINSFSNFVQNQDKLNSLVNSGGRESDVNAVAKQLNQAFASISDETARKDIISSGGDVKKLSEALAKAQARTIQETRVAEASTTAAQEKDRVTSLGFTKDSFSSQAISGVSRSLIGAIDSKELDKFASRLSNIKENITESNFVESFQGLGVAEDQLKSIFKSLTDNVNRVSLVNSLIKEANLSKEFQESVREATLARKAITDLNKTIGTITSIQTNTRRVQLGAEGNAFNVQQNGAQSRAANKFFNLGDIGQGQLSAAFQTSKVQFDSSQDRERETLDLKDALSSFVSENRDSLSVKGNKDLSDALNKFIQTGQGNLSQLTEQALSKGVGSGEDVKNFSDLAKILSASEARLASIDDNERAQIQILRQNLDALKERVTLENRLNTLGGASGQINFRTEGFDKFKDRDVDARLAQRGGSVGQFGRAEQAQGVLEFQKAFGKLEGFDARDIIPNAEQLVRDSIRESLIQGFTRIGVELDSNKLKEINSIADVSAAKEFENKELTPEAIGKAVGDQFAYDRLIAGNQASMVTALQTTSVSSNVAVVPKIYDVLKQRFELQQKREVDSAALSETRGQKTQTELKVSQLRDENIKLARDKSAFTDVRTSAPIFSKQATDQAKQAGFVSVGTNELATVVKAAGGRDSSMADLRKGIDEVLNKSSGWFNTISADEQFLKNTLKFENSVEEAPGSNGKSRISDEGFSKLLARLQEVGAVKVDDKAAAEISVNNDIIAKLTSAIDNQSATIDLLKKSIDDRDKEIAAVVATPPKNTPTTQAVAAPSASALVGSPTSVGSTQSPVAKSFYDVTTSVSATFKKLQDGIVDFSSVVKAKVNELNTARFGDSTAATKGLELANKAAQLGGPDNRNTQRTQAAAQANVLKIAQSQQFNLGGIDPNLQKDVDSVRGKKSVQAKLGELNAEASFEGLIDDANEAFVSGFASDAEMKQIGIRISQGLNEYVDSQVKLGVDRSDAEKQANDLRETYQKQLDKLKIKIPKSELGQFGQGFSARLDELKADFNDVGQLGAQTADSLVDGFGDAFVDIISGATDAETATRKLLSSIAADIAKFYAKKAITTAITSGISAAGYNQGGEVVRRASGGGIGKVPAVVMGGEYKFGPEVVQAYGKDFFKDLNAGKIEPPKMASGGMMGGSGMIKGGSGHKDDVFSHFEEGSFILRKSAVNAYGKDYLDQIAAGGATQYKKGGKVQKAFWGALIGQIIGGAVQGAAVGAVTAKATGGDWKKGAMYGAIGGGIAGGVGGYSYASSNPNAGFGGGFANSFSWTGMGQGKEGNGGTLTARDPMASGAGTSSATGSTPGATGTIFDNPNLMQESKFNTSLSLSDVNRGYASGVGNNSLTAAQTAAKSPWYMQAGKQFAVAGAGLAASMALAPKTPGEAKEQSRDSYGSVTTYNTDGSVAINTSTGVKTLRPGIDFNSTAELESILARNGGNARTYATGGSVIRGSGRTMQRPMNTLARPMVTQGAGNKDDVYAKLKRGEFVLNDRAAGMYNRNGLVDRMNRQEIDPDDLDRSMGILKFEKGGPAEYNPSSRDRGLFSMGQTQAPTAPVAPAAGGGGINIEINVTIGAAGDATMTTKSDEEKTGGQREQNSTSGQAFAQKVKMLFMELVEQEKRPGGSLSKDNMS